MKKYFKVKLLSDVVINADLNTEGNMSTLDYIPGSNFLGIVASKLYGKSSNDYHLFHSGAVSFGDAHIALGDAVSYAMPFSLFVDKHENDVTKNSVYIHHAEKIPRDIFPKQVRSGFFNINKDYFPSVVKSFSIKSAYDSEKRRAADEQMYGFEAIKKGQEFIFSVNFSEEIDTDKVVEVLSGVHYIGKSKTAQYGRVKISPLEREPKSYCSKPCSNSRLIVYAESNLCFLNEYGQATFQPSVSDFGVKEGEIRWDLSQIRTYSYSPWNGKRNTTDTQRDVILKGSVIVIKTKSVGDIKNLPKSVGIHQSASMGRVLYNPKFLEPDKDGKWQIQLNKVEEKEEKNGVIEVTSALGKLLAQSKKTADQEEGIGDKIKKALDKHGDVFGHVPSSQWGAIRKYAGQYPDMEKLKVILFDPQKGYILNGVAAEKIWNKRGAGKKLKELFENNKELGAVFVAKFAAEMAKKKIANDSKNQNT